MSNHFRLILRVRYNECDAQQVVFNSRYADYVDIAATEYFRILFGSYSELLNRGIDNQVVCYSIDWKSPARFDEVISISLEPGHMGKTSYSLLIKIDEHYTGREIAIAEIRYVMVSVKKHEKMTIPDEYRRKLAAGAPGTTVNHSGNKDIP